MDLASLQGLQSGLELVADPAFAVDQDLRIVAANHASEVLVGESMQRWIGEMPLELVHPDDLPIVLSSFTEVSDKVFGSPIEIRIRCASGYRLVEAIGATHSTDDGHIVVVSMRDLTERRKWELASSDTELFRTVVEHASVLMLLLDADGIVTAATGTFNRQLGHDLSNVIGSRLADWISEEDRRQFTSDLQRATEQPQTSVFEATFVTAGLLHVPYQFSVANLIDDPVVGGLIVSASDISVRRVLETRLTRMANTDSLTGLANRSALVAALGHRLTLPIDARSRMYVFFVDLDRFKPINDLYGHESGDHVLSMLAKRLTGIARSDDIVARLGGDEFVVVCGGVADDAEAAEIAQRIEERVASPIALRSTAVQVFASVGWTDAVEATSAEALLAEADAAMYRVKTRRRGGLEPSNFLRVSQRRELAEELERALGHDPDAAGLEMHFQPVVRLVDTSIVGAEALIRWNHPRLGHLNPADFLPIAEEAALDVALGAWVIDSAVRECAAWGRNDISVAVNLAAAHLADPDLVHHVGAILSRHGLASEQLCLEVTETALLERAARGNALTAVSALGLLVGSGVQVAIDDFGTGYSSLVHVRELPAHILKIDRSFVSGMAESDADRGIVTAVIALAHAVGMKVVAEGIETFAQHRALLELGSDFAQGYRYGKAVPSGDFAKMLASQLEIRRAA